MWKAFKDKSDFFILIVLILVVQVLSAAQFHNTQVERCQSGNVTRSVTFTSAEKVGNKAGVAKLKAVPYSNGQGEIDCDAAIPSPWWVP